MTPTEMAAEIPIGQTTLYIAGPMRGYPHFNFPAFEGAAADLRGRGYRVISPAEADLSEGFDPASGEGLLRIDEYMAKDLPAVCSADAIVVLEGWRWSQGAGIEVEVAQRLGKPVWTYPDLAPLPDGDPEEVRVVNATTGGEKGRKLARWDLLPWPELAEVARLYGRGALKYEARNWEKGYDNDLSFQSLCNHLLQWWGGESYDPETKCHHLAAVIFHAGAMMRFERCHPELDHRPAPFTLNACAVGERQ